MSSAKETHNSTLAQLIPHIEATLYLLKRLVNEQQPTADEDHQEQSTEQQNERKRQRAESGEFVSAPEVQDEQKDEPRDEEDSEDLQHPHLEPATKKRKLTPVSDSESDAEEKPDSKSETTLNPFEHSPSPECKEEEVINSEEDEGNTTPQDSASTSTPKTASLNALISEFQGLFASAQLELAERQKHIREQVELGEFRDANVVYEFTGTLIKLEKHQEAFVACLIKYDRIWNGFMADFRAWV